MEYIDLAAIATGYAVWAFAVLYVVHQPLRFVSLCLFTMIAYARRGYWNPKHPILAAWKSVGTLSRTVEISTLNATWSGIFQWKFHRRKD